MSNSLEQIFGKILSPFIIAGPCSAESENQLEIISSELSKIPQVKAIRAGIWKPRTRPNSFEGIGENALPWLVNAAKKNNLLTAVEVANSSHVDSCLNAGIDILWIGARTTVNPFSVQEISDSLKGTSTIVMIKNPINPDLDLWQGAIERVTNSGIKKVIAIHRGFSTSEKQNFRNAPMWELPLELKRRMPDLPILCDPSHISGKRELIEHVSQKALDLHFNGLMIESHPEPQNALSDKEQQLTPKELTQIISRLIIKKPSGEQGTELDELLKLRGFIDDLDEKIIDLLADRMNISQKIGEYKRSHNMTIFQLERWQHIFSNRTDKGTGIGLSYEFLQKLLESIHNESIRRQENKTE